MPDLVSILAGGVEAARAAPDGGPVSLDVSSFPDDSEPPSDDVNEFCILIKPEICALVEPHLGEALGLIFEIFHDAGAQYLTALSIPGPWLKASGIIAKHYGAIDDVSHVGVRALSAEARQALNAEFLSRGFELERVLGAYQFLDRFDAFTSEALTVLYENLSSVRLGGGAHAAPVRVRGVEYVILNGFHPDQVDRFTNQRAVILALRGQTRTPWRELRQSITGATNPSRADPKSIRARLLADRTRLGLTNFNASMNGVHVSAGPVEAMAELVRYFGPVTGLSPDETSFGNALLARSGQTNDYLDRLSANPVIEIAEREGPVFDLTEELDAADAVHQLVTGGRS